LRAERQRQNAGRGRLPARIAELATERECVFQIGLQGLRSTLHRELRNNSARDSLTAQPQGLSIWFD